MICHQLVSFENFQINFKWLGLTLLLLLGVAQETILSCNFTQICFLLFCPLFCVQEGSLLWLHHLGCSALCLAVVFSPWEAPVGHQKVGERSRHISSLPSQRGAVILAVVPGCCDCNSFHSFSPPFLPSLGLGMVVESHNWLSVAGPPFLVDPRKPSPHPGNNFFSKLFSVRHWVCLLTDTPC